MFKIFFKLLKASVFDNLMMSIFKIVGLALGICYCLLLYLWIADELSWDSFHTKIDRTYRVVQVKYHENGETKNVYTPQILATALKSNFPQIETTVSYVKHTPPFSTIYQDKNMNFSFAWVTNDFFKAFDFPFVYKATDSAFLNENSAVISKECAEKMFGDEYPIGKTFEKIMHSKTTHIVSAVIDIPKNSHIQFDIATPFENTNFVSGYKTPWIGPKAVNYISFKRNSDLDDNLINEIEDFLKTKVGEEVRYIFQPVGDIHLHTDFSDQNVDNNGDIRYVQTFLIAVILVVFLSGLNFVILNIAQSEKRKKEIALKKIFGLSGYQIVRQHIVELILVTLIAYLIALTLFYILQPWFNHFTGKNLRLRIESQSALFFIATWGLIVVMSVSYYVIWISSIRLMDLFKNTSQFSIRILKLGSFIMPLQLILSFFFIVCSISIFQQLRYMQEKDKGLDLKNIVAVSILGLTYEYEEIKAELLKNANVYSVTASSLPPIDYHSQYENIDWAGKGSEKNSVFCIYRTDASFLETFNIKLLEGSFIPAEYTFKEFLIEDKYLGNACLVINKSAQALFGFENPIGKKLDFKHKRYNGYISGVVEDFNFQPLNNQILPMILAYEPSGFREMYIKINPKNKQETIEYIENITVPYRDGKHPFDYYFLEDKVNSLYKAEKNMVGFALLFAVVSVALAIMGIIGMVSHMVKHQRKSIAVRKVFGARTKNIILLYVKRLALITSISFLIAGLIAWYYLGYWLQNYAYHIRLSPMMFAVVFAIAFAAICLLTVAMVYKESNKNPVINLKYE